MADFNFYLNKSGIRGQKGEKGDTGFSPSIVEEVNTLTDYRLKIINEFDEFVTDNLRGSDYFDITDPNGTYLRFDKESGRAYTGTLNQATNETIGGARLANIDDMETFSENTIVTPALFADSLVDLIVSPDGSLNITQNEQTSKTEITFNSATLDAVRAELNRVKEDLTTESQVRSNADNQLQSAINTERRERETQDAALQNQISSLGDNFVNISGDQTILGRKIFASRLRISDGTNRNPVLSISAAGEDAGYITPISGKSLIIGERNSTIEYGGITKFNYNQPIMHKDTGDYKLLSQDTVEQGDNIIVEQTTNGIKISSTTSGGVIIDDTDPATDKVYSSSKTSDLIGELGDEVNSIAGRLNTLEGEVKVATTENLGLVQPDGTTITIDSDGKISAVGGGSGDVTAAGNNVFTGSNTFTKDVLIKDDYYLYTDTLGSIKKHQGDIIINDGFNHTIQIGRTTRINTNGTTYLSGMEANNNNFIINPINPVRYIVNGEDKGKLLSSGLVSAGANVTLDKNSETGEVTINCTASTPEVDNVTIEVNDSGKLQTTVDINALQERVEELQLYKFPNATIIGTPTINNGQITDFSTTSYLQFPFEFKSEGRTWLLNGSFDTESDVTTQQNIIDSLASVALAVRNGRLVLALSTNGTSFNLGEHESMSDILSDTKYYYRLSFSGTQYLLSISTDKQQWLPEIIVTSGQPIASRPMTISSSGHPFKGVLNLNDWNLTVANTLVWQGMDDVGIASRMDVNASNITETGKQAIRDIVGSISVDAYTKAESDALLNNKEDRIVAGDGISVSHEQTGMFSYDNAFKALVDSGSNIPEGNITLFNKYIDTRVEDIYFKFDYEVIATGTYFINNTHFGVDNVFGIGINTSQSYAAIDVEFGTSSYSKDYATLGINENDNIRIELSYNHLSGVWNLVITNIDSNTVLENYTITNKISVTSQSKISSSITAWVANIPARSIVATNTKDSIRNVCNVSARIDNDTIISDNGVLKVNIDRIKELLGIGNIESLLDTINGEVVE